MSIILALLRRWAHCLGGTLRGVCTGGDAHRGVTGGREFLGFFYSFDLVSCDCGRVFHEREGTDVRYYVAVRPRLDDPVHDHRTVHWCTYYDGWQLATSAVFAWEFHRLRDAVGAMLDLRDEHHPQSAMVLQQRAGMPALDGFAVVFVGKV